MRDVKAKRDLFEMMARGEKPLGIFISSLDPASTDIAAAAGFDYVVLDGEHGRLGRIEVEHHVRAALAGGTVPFVRILENSQTLIQATLDVGAQGLVVPHVDTAADARAAVAASRYSPNGRRGMCPASLAGAYTLDGWPERVRSADDNIMVIPIIESRKAVENIDEILAVDGIDVVHFGPGDLSADMGIDFSTQLDRMMAAWRKTLAATHAAGKKMLAPRGFGFDDADMLLVEMEYMVLRRVLGDMIAEHKATLPIRQAAE